MSFAYFDQRANFTNKFENNQNISQLTMFWKIKQIPVTYDIVMRDLKKVQYLFKHQKGIWQLQTEQNDFKTYNDKMLTKRKGLCLYHWIGFQIQSTLLKMWRKNKRNYSLHNLFLVCKFFPYPLQYCCSNKLVFFAK